MENRNKSEEAKTKDAQSVTSWIRSCDRLPPRVWGEGAREGSGNEKARWILSSSIILEVEVIATRDQTMTDRERWVVDVLVD